MSGVMQSPTCDHQWVGYVRGGEPLSLRICTECGWPDWSDLRMQLAPLIARDESRAAADSLREKLRAATARAERAEAAEADLRATVERVTAQRDEKIRQFDAVAGTRSVRIEELQATVERVRALHVGERRRLTLEVADENGGGTVTRGAFVCAECNMEWPCPTIAALDAQRPAEGGPEGEGARTLRADLADEADWIDKRGGMISAAWVADAMRHLAQYGHRRPRAGESTHVHNAPAALDGGQPDTPAPTRSGEEER